MPTVSRLPTIWIPAVPKLVLILAPECVSTRVHAPIRDCNGSIMEQFYTVPGSAVKKPLALDAQLSTLQKASAPQKEDEKGDHALGSCCVAERRG